RVGLGRCGGSAIWGCSTTLWQRNTHDPFRGGVFAADLGLSLFTTAIGAYLAGAFRDWAVSARIVSAAAGASMLLPAAAWAWALRLWKRETIAMRPETADRV